MATKKKSVVQEFKELLEEQSVSISLTPEQQQKIRDVNEKINDIKYNIHNQRDQDDIGMIKFDMGEAYNEITWCEEALDQIIETFPKLPQEEGEDDYDY
jgi:hypothetical protein